MIRLETAAEAKRSRLFSYSFRPSHATLFVKKKYVIIWVDYLLACVTLPLDTLELRHAGIGLIYIKKNL